MEDRENRLKVVRRLAFAMAQRNDDQILRDVEILSETTLQLNVQSAEELAAKNPVATQEDGGCYFAHVRMDGRGQLNIVWPDGTDKTIKFHIPPKYLESLADKSEPKLAKTQAIRNEAYSTLVKLRENDPVVPLTIADIPGFPYQDFSTMIDAIQKGDFAISRFSYQQEPKILRIIAPDKVWVHLVSGWAIFIVPLVSVVLAFTVSSWFWLGILYFFLGSRLPIAIWKKAIFDAAHRSESEFCLLFCTAKINAYSLKPIRKGYDWPTLTEQG